MSYSTIMTYDRIPAMTPPVVLDHLRDLGRTWTKRGVGVELGCWLGATAAALLSGLKDVGYDRPFYCYDRWTANESEVKKAHEQGTEISINENLLPLFLKNVDYDNIRAYRGSIFQIIHNYPGDPIEFCLFDAPKRSNIFNEAVEVLSPYWIPGVTVLGLMDYYFYEHRKDFQRFMAPVQFMKKYKDNFSIISEWRKESTSVFFKYERRL